MNAQLAASLQNLKERLNTFPRMPLCNLPTPLEKLDHLSRKLNLNLYIKRDDETGLAMGGNKARKMEFIVADALAQGADAIVTWGGVQSNWCRQLAAAARRAGVQPFLVLFKRPRLPSERNGNLFLDEIFGADITVFELEKGSSISGLDQVQKFVDPVIERARKAGRKPYLAPIGGSRLEGSMNRPWGAIAYVNAMLELTEQAEAQGVAIDQLVFATGSGSTHAGLLTGARLLGLPTTIVGISVSGNKDEIAEVVEKISDQVLAQLGTTDLSRESREVTVFGDYVGEGYAILSSEIVRAIRMVAENEGILLDPVYTGKAMAGLLDLCERGYFAPKANVVFLHTGGTPALFSYRAGILEDRQTDF
jgi:L-cysteate sulfo-lyase